MRWAGHVVRMGEECGDEPSGSCATELVRNHYYHGNAYNNKHIHTYYPTRPKIPKLKMIPNQHFLTVYTDQKSCHFITVRSRYFLRHFNFTHLFSPQSSKININTK
jgi:hypothetical protein